MYGKAFFVEFQSYPLKFHTKYLTHTLKDVWFFCMVEIFTRPRAFIWCKQVFLLKSTNSGCFPVVSVQERRNSIANALELRLSSSNLSLLYVASCNKNDNLLCNSSNFLSCTMLSWVMVPPWQFSMLYTELNKVIIKNILCLYWSLRQLLSFIFPDNKCRNKVIIKNILCLCWSWDSCCHIPW